MPEMKTYRDNLYRLPLSLSARLIDSDTHLDDLVRIEQACFPERLQEDRQDFMEYFEDDYATGLLLYEDGKLIGYTIGTHIDEDNSPGIIEENALIRENKDRIFYLCSTAILKEHRSVITLDFLVHEMIALLKSLDYTYLVSHLRAKHGLTRVMKTRYKAKILFTDPDWEESGEAFDYCLMDFADIPTLSTPVDYFFQGLRVFCRIMKGIKMPD